MNKIGKLFMATAIAVLPVACKDSTRDEADKAAENVQDQREDVTEDTKDLKEAIQDQRENLTDHAKTDTDTGRAVNDKQLERGANEIEGQSKEIAENAGELATAESTFDLRRSQRAAQLRAVHGVVASQPMLINALGGVTALTDKARAGLAEKMQVFQMRVDEAGNAIEGVQAADATGFEDRNDAAAKAMDRLEDARDDAWEALNDGDRIEAS